MKRSSWSDKGGQWRGRVSAHSPSLRPPTSGGRRSPALVQVDQRGSWLPLGWNRGGYEGTMGVGHGQDQGAAGLGHVNGGWHGSCVARRHHLVAGGDGDYHWL